MTSPLSRSLLASNRLSLSETDQTNHSDSFQTNSVSTTLTNSSSSLAFLIRLRVTNGGNEVLPVFWSDNYITLLPGETRTEAATFDAGTLPAGSIVQVDGFNITPN